MSKKIPTTDDIVNINESNPQQVLEQSMGAVLFGLNVATLLAVAPGPAYGQFILAKPIAHAEQMIAAQLLVQRDSGKYLLQNGTGRSAFL